MADGRPDEDSDLVAAAVRGDHDAFEGLVRLYERRIVTFVRGFVRADDEAEDLAQEVSVRVFRGLPSFRGDSSFQTWLYKVA